MKSRLDATFERAAGVPDDSELLSDFARYLCVLVAGYLEQAVIELAMEHVRSQSSPSVQRHVEARLRRFTNPKAQKLADLFGSFSPDWRSDLETYLSDERKAAVDSVVDLRHTIAHGRSVGVTISRVQNYYEEIGNVVSHISGFVRKDR